MKRGWWGLLIAILAACGGAPSAPASPTGAGGGGSSGVTLHVTLAHHRFRLPNGLEVVLHRDPALRNVIVDVRYHVGSKDDPPGRSGFAHLFEHLMFLGSKKVSERDFAQVLEDAGALEFNAHTTQDVTEYYEVVPPSELPVALWIEADRMAHPAERVREDSLRRERDVVKNEWRERYDNVPYGHVSSIVRAAVFPEGHPYHLPPIGRAEDLDRATVDDARAFAARYYMPANASMVVAGDIDVAEAKALVERHFGVVPQPAAPPPPRTFRFPRLDKDRRVVVEADVQAPRAVVAWPVPPPYAPGYNEIHFAASTIRGMTAYKLETEEKIARDVSFSIDDGRLGSVLEMTFELEPGADPDSAVSALETRVRWVAELASNGQEWRDFADMRTQRMTRRVLALGQINQRAERIQDYLDVFAEADVAQEELRRIQAVRAVEASSAAHDLLHDSSKVVVVVVPTKGAPRSGRVKR